MKKLFIFLAIITSISVSSDAISFRLQQGIPVGDWAYDANSGNDISVLYIKKTGKVSFPAGVSLSSLTTDSYFYRINIASLNAGVQYNIYSSGPFSIFLCHLAGISLIEKSLYDYAESGFREVLDNSLGAAYSLGGVSFSMILNYKRIGVIEGADYISFGAALDILSTELFNR